jgi:hypothetical protein
MTKTKPNSYIVYESDEFNIHDLIDKMGNLGGDEAIAILGEEEAAGLAADMLDELFFAEDGYFRVRAAKVDSDMDIPESVYKDMKGLPVGNRGQGIRKNELFKVYGYEFF